MKRRGGIVINDVSGRCRSVMEVGQDLRTLWRTLEPRPLTRSPRLRRQHFLLTVAVELTHEIPYYPPNVKGKILRSTKPNKPVKTMNKKIVTFKILFDLLRRKLQRGCASEMQILPKTNQSETKVTNTGVSKPPQIGGSTVSRSRGLENNFFLHPKPFSENSHTGHSKNVQFLRFRAIFGRENGS